LLTAFIIFARNFKKRQTNMKKLTFVILSATIFAGCSVLKNVDTGRALQAGATALTAVSITDAQVIDMCRQAMVQTDSENTIAPDDSPYAQRLARLTSRLGDYGGLNLNFKAYIKDEVNAFASGDGSVRVYSGLMDVMDDDQLMAIVGHEIGHVKNHDVKDAVKKAYETAAMREAAGAVGGTVGTLSDSMLGDIAETWVNAQYSQKQENEADNYGFQFTVDNDRDPYAMARSMQKLQELSGEGAATPGLMQAFASHPDTASREARMRRLADDYAASHN
jgi:putative metalloprotease